MLFYRFQNTKEVEKNSYYVDLNLLYDDLREYKDEYGENLDTVLYAVYHNTLNMREDISATELFNLVKSSNWNEIDSLAKKYPLKYIFGMRKDEVDQYYSLKELTHGKDTPWCCEGSKYLVLYEGDLISDEGEGCGCIFKPHSILEIHNTHY